MRRPRIITPGETGFNMTPMIDVTFLLLIFFLVSSQMARNESKVNLNLPRAATSVLDEPNDATLTVNVLADGSWLIGGQPVKQVELAAALQGHLARHGATAPVRIRGDQSVVYEKLEPILREAAGAGLMNVSIAVLPEAAR